MPSIQRDKKEMQTMINGVMPKDLFAIDINATAQKSEVTRYLDAALRSQQRVTVCIIKH